MKYLKVVVADDSIVIREQVRRSLTRIDGLIIVGLAAAGGEALKMVRALKPDLVVLDMMMPEMTGLEVLRELQGDDPSVTTIMFTSDPSPALRNACFKAGADFFFEKSQLDSLIDVCRELLVR